jgi:hypothetical protein
MIDEEVERKFTSQRACRSHLWLRKRRWLNDAGLVAED